MSMSGEERGVLSAAGFRHVGRGRYVEAGDPGRKRLTASEALTVVRQRNPDPFANARPAEDVDELLPGEPVAWDVNVPLPGEPLPGEPVIEVPSEDPGRNGPRPEETTASAAEEDEQPSGDDVDALARQRAGADDRPSREQGTAEPEPFVGRSHAEVLEMRFGAEPPELVEGIVPRGVLVVVAGLPETYKGWTCAKLAYIVAAGAGELFGREACAQGSAGYFWQDDSTRNEAERVQLFARVHETPPDLPLRWFLNEGAILPDDLGRLRATIERYRFVLVVLDSVYNFVPGLDLKDRDVGQLFARIKAEVCDPTGCTVVVVDHMPWATEQNRKRLRSYGDVFKGAAARAGIYIDAEGARLWVEARGNNVRGFKRTPAYWDADALELRLVDATRQDEADEELDARVLEWLDEHPGSHSTTRVREAVKGRAKRVDAALERLLTSSRVRDHGRDGGTWSGRGGDPRYWIASVHAENTPSQLVGTWSDEAPSGGPEGGDHVPSSRPRRGDVVDRDGVRKGTPHLPDRDLDLPEKPARRVEAEASS